MHSIFFLCVIYPDPECVTKTAKFITLFVCSDFKIINPVPVSPSELKFSNSLELVLGSDDLKRMEDDQHSRRLRVSIDSPIRCAHLVSTAFRLHNHGIRELHQLFYCSDRHGEGQHLRLEMAVEMVRIVVGAHYRYNEWNKQCPSPGDSLTLSWFWSRSSCRFGMWVLGMCPHRRLYGSCGCDSWASFLGWGLVILPHSQCLLVI